MIFAAENKDSRDDCTNIGFVVIGRNEAKNLGDALGSLPRKASAVVYVDSGSTDSSVQIAIEKGVQVHALGSEKPFSAARGREEGVKYLLERYPSIELIQFLDGDCVLDPGWIASSVNFLDDRLSIGVVCGLLVERDPSASIYNRFNAVRWRSMPRGDVVGSGGIFLARTEVYMKAGGFRAELSTGEELDFCRRVINSGYRVTRIPVPMAEHDSELLRFRDWWERAVWGGRGDALQREVLGGPTSTRQRREMLSVATWGIAMPGVICASAVLSLWDGRFLWGVAIGFAGYVAIATRILLGKLRQGESWFDAVIYSTLAVARKLPYAVGYFGPRKRL